MFEYFFRGFRHFHPFVKLPPEESISVSVEHVQLTNSMSERRFSDFWFIHKLSLVNTFIKLTFNALHIFRSCATVSLILQGKGDPIVLA